MNTKKQIPSLLVGLLWGTFMLVALLAGCKADNSVDPVPPFDANKATVVSGFLPKNGGMGSRVVVYGDNFGNDTSRVKVTIGGIPAKVISVKGNSLLCIVPSKAYEGTVRVSVCDLSGNEVKWGESTEKFSYQRRTLVTTLMGKTLENNTKYDIKAGPFDDCGGFARTLWLKFDPLDPDMLYCAAEKQAFRIFDFKKRYADIFTTNIANVSCVDFTLQGDMLLSDDHGYDTKTGIYMFTRESGFKNRLELVNGRGVKTVATHPITGRVYYTLYRKGEMWSVDPYSPYDNRMEVSLPRTGTGVLMVWHPSGNYCYLILYERHTIWRCDYNKETHQLSQPYLICGKDNTYGYADGVGGSVRVKKPWQGIFLKNPTYKGQEDEYDFYFVDNGNHCIRILTPLGRVSTYAGRANGGTSGYRDGELRTEAMFYYPESIVWDEARQCIYIGDANNRVIRKIAPEE